MASHEIPIYEKKNNFRPYASKEQTQTGSNTSSNENVAEKLIKYERDIENANRVIAILDERAGPAYVDSNDSSSSDSDTKSIPTVDHEVEQRDQFFAKSFTFTTNVSTKFK